MSIENDESLWPEGAQFYIKPRLENRCHKEGFFARTCAGGDTLKEGLRIDGQPYEVYTRFWGVNPRPTANKYDQGAPTLPWPQVGVECEFSLDAGCTYKWCEVLGRHGRAVWLRTRHGYSAFFIDRAIFRPIRALRDEAVSVVEQALSEAYSSGPAGTQITDADLRIYATAAVGGLMAKYDLKEKTK